MPAVSESKQKKAQHIRKIKVEEGPERKRTIRWIEHSWYVIRMNPPGLLDYTVQLKFKLLLKHLKAMSTIAS